MATVHMVKKDMHRLFDAGTLTGRHDAQLLETFVTRRDEAAFAALVARHGPMVLATCRAVLRDHAAAEDAFQATFLVLARRASTVRRRDALGGWLHRVAYRVAVEANRAVDRRRDEERNAAAMKPTTTAPADPGDELRTLLHTELERLPEALRLAVVLCDLEGLSREEAARELRWTEGTLRGRLARGRDRLRARLTRQGVGLSLTVMTAVLGREASAAVPPSWAAATALAAKSVLTARTAAGTAGAAVLAECVVQSMAAARLRAAALWACSTAAAALGIAAGVAAFVPGGPTQAPSAKAETPLPKPLPAVAADETARVTIRGRVLNPDGQPQQGSKVYLSSAPTEDDGIMPPAAPARATTDRAGRFSFDVPRTALVVDKNAMFGLKLAAQAEGFGPGWVAVDAGAGEREWEIRLSRDDVPVVGRVIGLEGRPVAGATVAVNGIIDPPGGAAAWVQALRDNKGRVNPELWGRMRPQWLVLGGPGALPTARTGPDGRFTLNGIGRDRIAVVIVEGPTITMTHAIALTTADPAYTPVPMPGDGSNTMLQGPNLTMTAPPAREVVGVVRDRDTGRPIAGVTVHSSLFTHAVTDAQGRYRLGGQPRTPRVEVTAFTPDQPYLKVEKTAESGPGLGPMTVDITLKRGVWVEGRVTDKVTGKPVAAVAEYYPLRDNAHVAEAPDFAGLNNNVSDEPRFKTDADGRFRAVALPGPGLIAVRAEGGAYLTAEPLTEKDAGNVLHAANFQYQMRQYQGLVKIFPATAAVRVSCDVQLTPGKPLRLTVADPSGRPLTGSRAFNLAGPFWSTEPSRGAEAEFIHPEPGQARGVTFIHEGRKLGGVIDVRGDENGPLTVTLRPLGSLTGRLVDEDGQPRPGVDLQLLFLSRARNDTFAAEHLAPNLTTDRDGRFKVPLLVPGVRYEIEVVVKGSASSSSYVGHTWWTVEPGESKDWGDVRAIKIGGG